MPATCLFSCYYTSKPLLLNHRCGASTRTVDNRWQRLLLLCNFSQDELEIDVYWLAGMVINLYNKALEAIPRCINTSPQSLYRALAFGLLSWVNNSANR